MRSIFIIILSTFYTFAAMGTTLQVHQCSGSIMWTMSNKKSMHEHCPICHPTEKQEPQETKSCKEGDCKDLEFKFDQLANKLFANAKDNVQIFSPAIIVLPWIQDLILFPTDRIVDITTKDILAYSDSSPPTYIFHCTFRI